MKYDFSGKVIIASGAASGMGFVACKRFVEYGGSAVMCDINKEALDAAVREVCAVRDGAAVGAVCDVRDYSAVCAARDMAVEHFGRIDLVVPFAGGSELRILGIRENDFVKVPIEAFDWSIDVNLKSQLYFDHAVLPVMKEQGNGTIVHVGSIAGQEGTWTCVGYSTAKSGAMYGLTKSIAEYGAPFGITCNCVSPGPVLTRPEMVRMKTALGRAAEPDEIINMVFYLASPEGSFITGQNILMDGGRSLLPKA